MPPEPRSTHDTDSGYDAAGPGFSLCRKIGFLLGVPLFLFLLWPALTPGLSDAGRRLLATSGLMAFWWITEAIPIPATALLPMCLYPLLGILPMAAVTRNYGDENIFLFLGGFFIAMAMQKWKLHRRLALQIVRLIGASPPRLVLGFMCATGFISMWISNTATTMMMYPIALAVILQLTPEQEGSFTPAHANFRTCMMLAIAYAASIGGIGTLIGTPPNIIFASNAHKLFPEAPPVDFLHWLVFGVPLILLFLPITWLLLTRLLFPITTDLFTGGRDLIDAEIKKLGRMSAGEHGVLAIFLLDWVTAVKIPWGILLLFGGGIAMSAGFKSTGLSLWLGERLAMLGDWPPFAMIITVCLVVTFLTEVTSNTATATIFMPIMAATAQALHLHPFLLMIPAAISASCAFMLPVATPPNAIVFASGFVTVPQMARAGIWLNLIGVVLVTAIVYMLVVPVFQIDFSSLPSWAR